MRRGPVVVALLAVLVAGCGTRVGDVRVADAPSSTAGIARDSPTATSLATTGQLSEPAFPAALDLPQPRLGGLGVALVDGYALPIVESTAGRLRAQTPCGAVVELDVSTPTSPAVLVVFDPGHGGPDDRGLTAESADEADVSLAVALAAAERLRRVGVDSMLTRTEDVALPTAFRRSVVEASGALVLVSIHMGEPSSDSEPSFGADPGAAAVVRTDHRESERLGGLLHAELADRVPVPGVLWPQPAEVGVFSLLNQRGSEFYGVLRVEPADVAGAFVQIAVLSDESAVNLAGPDVHATFGEALAAAVVRQLTTSDRGTPFVVATDPVRGASTAAAEPCSDPFAAAAGAG